MKTKKRPRNYWTYDLCKKEALKYKSKTEWQKRGNVSYKKSLKNGWINQLSKHMKSTSEILSENKTIWTLEKCKKIAKQYKTKIEWKKGHNLSYNAASKHKGWVDICGKHMVSAFIKWDTKEKCLEEAKKFKAKKQWHIHSPGSYKSALKNGWFEECSAHMKKNQTLEDCLKDALKYKTKNEWLKNSSGAFWSAYSRGWYKKCTAHMETQPNCDLREKRFLNKVIKILNKEFKNENIKIEKEIMIGRHSFPDLVIHLKNHIYIIELKHDKSQWKKIKIKRQQEKYTRDGIKKYGSQFKACLVCSSHGKYGQSLENTLIFLKNNINDL